MTKALRQVRSKEVVGQGARRLRLTPFGRAAPPIAGFTAADRGLLADLFRLDRARAQLIGLVPAHAQADATQQFGRFTRRGSVGRGADRILERYPACMPGPVGRMPIKVVGTESYRRLAELITHETRAKPLFRARPIDDSTVKSLSRKTSGSASANLARTGRVVSWTRRTRRGPAYARRARCGPKLGCAHHGVCLNQMASAIRHRAEAMGNRLPLPATRPPERTGLSRRLDCCDELRLFAKR